MNVNLSNIQYGERPRTGNSINEIVSGSKVIRYGSRIYDVGEIIGNEACLYFDGKAVGWFPVAELVCV